MILVVALESAFSTRSASSCVLFSILFVIITPKSKVEKTDTVNYKSALFSSNRRVSLDRFPTNTVT